MSDRSMMELYVHKDSLIHLLKVPGLAYYYELPDEPPHNDDCHCIQIEDMKGGGFDEAMALGKTDAVFVALGGHHYAYDGYIYAQCVKDMGEYWNVSPSGCYCFDPCVFTEDGDMHECTAVAFARYSCVLQIAIKKLNIELGGGHPTPDHG